MSLDLWNRCDECGRFIPLNDFAERKALHWLQEPDSDLGNERWETLCAEHFDRSRKRASGHVPEVQSK
jgi:hypothetical protein